ncbi:ABC transporter [Microbacterium sp. NPDC076911]|uniref:ABC transporter n=1 Tax=Microbacterium sp. NPDC076911 TaxID=3154958 RepID=UPI00342B22CF
MSDPKSSYGEPVDEPTSVDDVVGRANEGLADAEAARGDAVNDATSAPNEAPAYDGSPSAADEASAGETPIDPDANVEKAWADEYSSLGGDPIAEATPVAAAPATENVGSAETAGNTPAAAEPVTTAYAPSDDAVTTAYAPADAPTEVAPVTPSEPAIEYVAPAATGYAQQPIFVQAPEAPRPRGNRAAAGAIGLLAAIAFGVLYLGAWLGFGAITGAVTIDNVGTAALDALATWSLWVPVVVFYVAFWLLGAIINRGRWGAWVIFGLLVGVASYAGHILGALFQAPFWTLTASEGAALVEAEMLAPLAIAAFVIGRELTIWFGAWVAARGKRVTELNVEAQREYERTLEAGPQLTQQ